MPKEKEDSVPLDQESSSVEECFVLDNTGDSSILEVFNTADIPEGVCLDTEGDDSVLYDQDGGADDSVVLLDTMPGIPSYEPAFTGILKEVEYSMETGKKINDAAPRQSCCFNCEGPHNISECKEPMNYQKINQNRKKQRKSAASKIRYHEEDENRFGQLQPGKISEQLRHALGLRHYQLPEHIYRMRVLGYPPGWMREAEVHQAQMSLFDGDGKSVSHPNEESGESEPTNVKYKPEKLVSFPGFNTSIPRGFRDEARERNFPPMQQLHQREEFERYMKMNVAETYRKKKLKSGVSQPVAQVVKPTDMDVDDADLELSSSIEFNPPLPSEPMPPLPQDVPPPPPTLPALPLEDGECSDESETGMDDLEERRKKILRELEGGNSNSNSNLTVSTVDKEQSSTETEAKEVTEGENEAGNLTKDISYSESGTEESSQDEDTLLKLTRKPKNHHRSKSKGFELGATIPSSVTPYNVLPHPDKWTVDVTDHILFDNLPDALGTWTKMKGLMSHVKDRMEQMHKDD